MIAFDMRYSYFFKQLITPCLSTEVFHSFPLFILALFRCVGFVMAKMVLRELMDQSSFMKFKSFLNKVLFTQLSCKHLELFVLFSSFCYSCKFSSVCREMIPLACVNSCCTQLIGIPQVVIWDSKLVSVAWTHVTSSINSFSFKRTPTRIICLFQILDRNWGAGWNLLSLLLATKPSQRIR